MTAVRPTDPAATLASGPTAPQPADLAPGRVADPAAARPAEIGAPGAPVAWPPWLSVEEATTPGPDGLLAVGEHWSGFGGAHGGLLVAAAARAMEGVVQQGRALRSIHADLQGAVASGALQLAAEVDRAGRGVTFARASGLQGGRTRIAATGVFGDSAPGIELAPGTALGMPHVPPVSMCEPLIMRGGPALQTIEFRPARDPMPLSGHAGTAELLVWVRIHGDPAPVDCSRVLILLDAPAPGLFATLRRPVPIPTVEFTAHLFPAAHDAQTPWALARMRTLVAGDGYCVDDCELWDEDGALLATSRQLRRVMVG